MNKLSETSTEILYQAPSSMYVFFWMAGMAFIVSSICWLHHAIKHPKSKITDFNAHIWKGQIQNLLFISTVSILFGIYNYVTSALPPAMYGETIILGAGTIAAYALNKGSGIKSVLTFYMRIILFGILCLIGWLLTIGLAFIVYYALKTITIMSHYDYFLITFMITGGAWGAPIAILYLKIIKSSELRPALKGLAMHKFMWPILLAYLSLLTPLVFQETANSENWRRMTNKKPIRTVQIKLIEPSVIFPFV